MNDDFASDVVAAFAETAATLHASEDLDETLGRLTSAAVDLVEGCDMASVSLLTGTTIRTAAPTDPMALVGDTIQYRCGEGPCLDAASEHRLVYAADLSADERWPEFSRQVSAELGVHSLLACRLQVRRETNVTLGALNMYAFTRDAFDDDDAMTSVLLASHSAVVIDASARQMSLRAAIESRDVIGQAKGILMERYRISDTHAFSRLRGASQRMNRRLIELAEQLALTGEDPTTPT